MSGFLEKFQPVYLERHSDGLFAEPFNALSNIAFLIAAYLAYRLASQDPQDRRWECRVLPPLLAAIGIGSLLFHTARNGYTFLCDTIPIAVFILLVMFSLSRWLTKSVGWGLCSTVLFAMAQTLMPRGTLNGSLPYILTLIVLIVLTAEAFYRRYEAATLVLLCLSFALAVIFRSIDLIASPIFPMGTHWLWHIFAAISAYLAARFVIQETKNRP